MGIFPNVPHFERVAISKFVPLGRHKADYCINLACLCRKCMTKILAP